MCWQPVILLPPVDYLLLAGEQGWRSGESARLPPTFLDSNLIWMKSHSMDMPLQIPIFVINFDTQKNSLVLFKFFYFLP